MNAQGFISIGEAAKMLGLSTVTLRRMDKAGTIPPAHRAPRTGTRLWLEDEVESIREALRPLRSQESDNRSRDPKSNTKESFGD